MGWTPPLDCGRFHDDHHMAPGCRGAAGVHPIKATKGTHVDSGGCRCVCTASLFRTRGHLPATLQSPSTLSSAQSVAGTFRNSRSRDTNYVYNRQLIHAPPLFLPSPRPDRFEPRRFRPGGTRLPFGKQDRRNGALAQARHRVHPIMIICRCLRAAEAKPIES
jgi:hypothetical protein